MVALMLTILCVPALADGDVAGAVEQTWNDASEQIKSVVDNVVFPALDMVLAIAFFAKLGMAYFDYRKHGQFEWSGPAILFGCLVSYPDRTPVYLGHCGHLIPEVTSLVYLGFCSVHRPSTKSSTGFMVRSWGFLGDFFAQMGGMGVELFELEWVQAVVLFFSRLGWSLFGVSLVVAAFECGLGIYQWPREHPTDQPECA